MKARLAEKKPSCYVCHQVIDWEAPYIVEVTILTYVHILCVPADAPSPQEWLAKQLEEGAREILG